MLPKIPICPTFVAEESLSSWIERTACFYGCDLERWIGQFSTELVSDGEPPVDLDLCDKVRLVVSTWSGIPLDKIPPLCDAARALPSFARLAFCEVCWDADVRAGIQPYIRRHWLNWTTVHCAGHERYLSAKKRSVDAGASYVNWQEVWVSNPIWRNALQLQNRGAGAGSVWYQAPKQLPRCTQRLMHLLEQLADPADVLANKALGHVRETWRQRSEERIGYVGLPVLLENRIEVLRQAAALLTVSQ